MLNLPTVSSRLFQLACIWPLRPLNGLITKPAYSEMTCELVVQPIIRPYLYLVSPSAWCRSDGGCGRFGSQLNGVIFKNASPWQWFLNSKH